VSTLDGREEPSQLQGAECSTSIALATRRGKRNTPLVCSTVVQRGAIGSAATSWAHRRVDALILALRVANAEALRIAAGSELALCTERHSGAALDGSRSLGRLLGWRPCRLFRGQALLAFAFHCAHLHHED
jgi:hypothetical protein